MQQQYSEPQQFTEPVSSDEIYANVMQEERVKNIISQTSPDNQLTDIEWRIKGYKKNIYTQQWEKIDPKFEEPSPVLVGRYITFLSSVLNDNTRFTNLDSGEINKLMNHIIEWLVDDIDVNAEEYGLGSNYTERTRICNILLGQVFLVLKRSQNGMESRRIWSSISMNESINQQPKKAGLAEALKFWK